MIRPGKHIGAVPAKGPIAANTIGRVTKKKLISAKLVQHDLKI